ncbi:hypothetical protein CLV32_0038 [Pedobacter duraquae]|uniref:Uncharacterized protein n=1 Tax=Pedobacter duraquae TaxID=425511 RepID=A0A4R6ING9_9SPHI|nr:hypothetical protein CLV32_0038 [Pedobacter duraquae]
MTNLKKPIGNASTQMVGFRVPKTVMMKNHWYIIRFHLTGLC